MKRILIVCSVVAAVVALRISNERLQDLQSRFGEIKTQLQDGLNETRSKRLRDIYENIPLLDARVGESSFLCGMCYSVVEDFFWIRRTQKESDEFMKSLAIALCVDLEIQSEEVCHGIVEFNAPSILFILDNRADLKADTVCKLLLNEGDCINPFKDDNLEFIVEISDQNISKSPSQFSGNENSLTIVHITDIHYDPKYKPGAFADCDEYACCREIDDINENDPGSTAGRWGDYRACDTPWCAIVNAFHQIIKQHSVNFYDASFIAMCDASF
jgi:sphingomyelin phosphodiesterase